MAAKGLRSGDTAAARAAQTKPLTDHEYEAALVEDMSRFYDDPEGFVFYAFPWGQGELTGMTGPDTWQSEHLNSLAAKLRKDPEATIREATASGHGIGKTTVVAWIIWWAMSTRPHISGVVTANTMAQLSSKTWREVALWHKRLVNRHWFKWTATRVWHIQHPETWSISAVPNSQHNSEAFAGLHAKYVLLIMDEASAIPDKIWEVAEGAMTTPRATWLAYGNPTQATGRFRACFDQDKKRWTTRHVDSRTAKMTNKTELNEWIEAYGITSDFVKVRILGQFPSAGAMQFIATGDVDRAMLGEIPYEAYCHQPVVIGVDVARYGDDQSVVIIRQGRKLHEVRRYRELNTMQLTAKIIEAMKDYGGAAVTYVDGVGVGAGVVDRLQQLSYSVVEINGGAKAYDEVKYFNATSEQWDRMRDWIKTGDMPSGDVALRHALIGREFYFDEKERIRMERKSDMKRRGLASPDEADALAHSFAEILGDVFRNSFDPTDNHNSLDPE
jgi:hypothetical protein